METSLARRVWALIKPYWKSEERWRAGGLLGIIIALNLGEVYIVVLLNKWNNDFYNALQAVDKKAFFSALGTFSYLAFSFIIVAVYKIYLNQMLRIKWRRWMTSHYLSDWLKQQNYYRMQLLGNPADNPDQRISEDIEQFLLLTITLSLGLMSAVVTLISFLAILWGLSGSLAIPIGETTINVPGYMVWVAIVYAIVGTWLTVLIGRPLVKLNFNQQMFEADFRFSLVRLRENTESIAFYRVKNRKKSISPSVLPTSLIISGRL
ncbi:MAG: SbmA/BacA-like family transporter [Rickettsiales bacterium]